MDKYNKQLKDFLNMLQGRLKYAWDEMDNGNDKPLDTLYDNHFTLSFMGKSCKIAWGAEEYTAIEEMLYDLIEE